MLRQESADKHSDVRPRFRYLTLSSESIMSWELRAFFFDAPDMAGTTAYDPEDVFFAPLPTHSRTEIIDRARSVLCLSLTTHNCYNPLCHYDAAYCTEWCSSLLSMRDGAAAKPTPRCWERANMLPQTHTDWHTIFTGLWVTISHGRVKNTNVRAPSLFKWGIKHPACAVVGKRSTIGEVRCGLRLTSCYYRNGYALEWGCFNTNLCRINIL